MPITDDRTPHLNLPLPYADNMLEDDSDRLRAALTAIDTAVAAKQANLGYTAENLAAKGVANGYAGLGGDGKVPAGQLPSYVDDVIEVANFAALPVTGEFGKIYVTLATNLTYRWGGSAYVEIASSPGSTDVVPEGSVNLYHSDARSLAAIPIASTTVLGKVKVGAGLGIDGAGLLFASAGGGSVMSVVDVVPASNGLSVIPIPAGYVVGAILVAFNGSLLGAGDYTATTGTSITLVGFTAGTVDTFTIISLSSVTIGSLPSGMVGTTQLTDGGVTTVKLADGSVTTAKLGAIASLNGGQLGGLRNRIINGDMRIDQRNSGASITVGATNTAGNYAPYTIDRFVVQSLTSNAGTGAAFSVQQGTGITTRSASSLKITVSTAKAVTESVCAFRVTQSVEGFNVQDFAFGTASAQYVTLSFNVKSSIAGQYSVGISNAGGTRSYAAPYTVTTANVTQTIKITIPGDIAGTWLRTNGSGLTVSFDLGSGSAFQTAANTWGSGNSFSLAGNVFFPGTLSATFEVEQVQLELGSVATTFEQRPYGMELALCQRYYEKSYDQGVVPGSLSENGLVVQRGIADGSGVSGSAISFHVEKRAVPTCIFYSSTTGTVGQWSYTDATHGISAITTTAPSCGTHGFYINAAVTGPWAAVLLYGHWAASAEL